MTTCGGYITALSARWELLTDVSTRHQRRTQLHLIGLAEVDLGQRRAQQYRGACPGQQQLGGHASMRQWTP